MSIREAGNRRAVNYQDDINWIVKRGRTVQKISKRSQESKIKNKPGYVLEEQTKPGDVPYEQNKPGYVPEEQTKSAYVTEEQNKPGDVPEELNKAGDTLYRLLERKEMKMPKRKRLTTKKGEIKCLNLETDISEINGVYSSKDLEIFIYWESNRYYIDEKDIEKIKNNRKFILKNNVIAETNSLQDSRPFKNNTCESDPFETKPQDKETIGDITKTPQGDISELNVKNMGPSVGSWEVDDDAISLSNTSEGEKGIQKDNTDLILMENKNEEVYFTLKEALEFLPKEFDGQNISIEKFIKNCKLADESVDPKYRNNLFRVIKTQREDETVQEFGNRIGEITNQIIEVTKETKNEDKIIALIEATQDAAAENFIIGLRKEIALRVNIKEEEEVNETEIKDGRTTGKTRKYKKLKLDSTWGYDDESKGKVIPEKRIVLMYEYKKIESSPEIEISNENFNNNKVKMVVDTGAEINLIKSKCVKSNVFINYANKQKIFGINKEGIFTVGEIQVDLDGDVQSYQLVPDDFPIKQDGILGMPFLKNSTIDLKKKLLIHKLGEFPIITRNKGKLLKIKARTKQLVEIPIINEENLDTGYLPLLPTGPGVYLGEVLVTIKNEFAKTFCINTTSKDIELIIPPTKIFDFEELKTNQKFKDQSRCLNLRIENEKERFEKLKEILKLEHLNDSEKQELIPTLRKYCHQFHLPGDSLGFTKVIQHTIETIDEVPVNSKYPRYPEVHKQEIKKQTEDLLKNKSISPSKAPYNSPVWIVPKKEDDQGNKKWRMVIDYRKLNEKTINDVYPLPFISEILDQIGGAKFFTILDLAQGFHQVEVVPKDRHKTAFSTPFGHYEFNRMPFGLKNSPSTFQRMMDRVLSGLQGIELFVYMDDIVIYAKSLKEHKEKLEKLLRRLKNAGLVLQPDKCNFLRKEIGYLGHIISENGVKPDPKKVDAVQNFPRPKTQKNIKQFLGLAGYYRRFIPNFAKIAKPMTNLLRKNVKFDWNSEVEVAFAQLKRILCTQPILQYPDFSKPFIVTTDASDFAIGAVLSQGEIGKDLPIAYASRTMGGAELRYSTTEKELLAIIFAIKQFRPYIFGKRFIIVTDHRALVWLNQLKDPTINSRLARWKIKLQDYDCEIIHRPGRVNSNADALSRNQIFKKLEFNLTGEFNEKLNNQEKRKLEKLEFQIINTPLKESVTPKIRGADCEEKKISVEKSDNSNDDEKTLSGGMNCQENKIIDGSCALQESDKSADELKLDLIGADKSFQNLGDNKYDHILNVTKKTEKLTELRKRKFYEENYENSDSDLESEVKLKGLIKSREREKEAYVLAKELQEVGLLDLEKLPIEVGQVLSSGEAAVETLKEALINEQERKTFSISREGITPHEMVFGKKARIPSEFAKNQFSITYDFYVNELLKQIAETESMMIEIMMNVVMSSGK
ncbi:uncharacterized protein LOC127278513 [Leptopilina boulardi]|uniref:uncharacterized protein LOC127278513 n=1 Tax=Leptopilina boulardi TaxID=63433 RepID=UPI0021F544E7|nr:uncharacterized protein LOC127278513 [Leptopilina boulardi]